MFRSRGARRASGHQTGPLSPARFGICLVAAGDNQRACVGLGQPLRATALSDDLLKEHHFVDQDRIADHGLRRETLKVSRI